MQLFFLLDRVKTLAPRHPELQTQEPFASILKGDPQTALAGGRRALIELGMATHTGMTTVEFEQIAKEWIATAKHPKTGKLFAEMTYQPMLELLAYLRANGIDVLLEPDATMLQHPAANNARLLKVFPQGFALDGAHRLASTNTLAVGPAWPSATPTATGRCWNTRTIPKTADERG